MPCSRRGWEAAAGPALRWPRTRPSRPRHSHRGKRRAGGQTLSALGDTRLAGARRDSSPALPTALSSSSSSPEAPPSSAAPPGPSPTHQTMAAPANCPPQNLFHTPCSPMPLRSPPALLGTVGDASPPPRVWDSISRRFTQSSPPGPGAAPPQPAWHQPCRLCLPGQPAPPSPLEGGQADSLGRAGEEEPSPICTPKPFESSSGEARDVRDIVRPRPERGKNMLAASSPASPVRPAPPGAARGLEAMPGARKELTPSPASLPLRRAVPGERARPTRPQYRAAAGAAPGRPPEQHRQETFERFKSCAENEGEKSLPVWQRGNWYLRWGRLARQGAGSPQALAQPPKGTGARAKPPVPGGSQGRGPCRRCSFKETGGFVSPHLSSSPLSWSSRDPTGLLSALVAWPPLWRVLLRSPALGTGHRPCRGEGGHS